MLESFMDELLKLAKFPAKATAAGRFQASQGAMNRFKSNLSSGNPFGGGNPKPAAQRQPKSFAPNPTGAPASGMAMTGRTAPVAPTNPSVKSPPGAANIGSGGIKPGFASKQYNPFGKQTAKGLGIPSGRPW